MTNYELRLTKGGMARGFTLVELLVVVGMIALIMGAISTSMSAAMQRARIQKATSEVKMLTQAILSYEKYYGKLDEQDHALADQDHIGFLFGDGQSETGTEVPVLISAALTGSGVMRDPWGEPYLVTIREGNVKSPAVDSLQTGYYLPNFYRLSEGERK